MTETVFAATLDACNADELTETNVPLLLAQAQEHGVFVRLVADRGPNDWPEFEYLGTEKALRAFLIDVYGLDVREVDGVVQAWGIVLGRDGDCVCRPPGYEGYDYCRQGCDPECPSC